MRAIAVTLMQNTGNTQVGVSTSLDVKIADLGTLSWQLDEQVTILAPGDCSLKVWDEDGSVWAFIQSQLGTVDPVTGANQFLPPWLIVTIAGQIRFLGIVDPTTIRRNVTDQIIQIGASDWSTMLRDQVLEGDSWTRKPPKVIATRASGGPWGASMIWPLYVDPSVNSTLTFADPITGAPTIVSGDITVGDTLRIGGVYCKAVNVFGNVVAVQGWNWGMVAPATTVTVNRESGTISDQLWYTATEAVTSSSTDPKYSVQFDTVDQVFPGDTLTRVGTGDTLKVDDIDPETMRVITIDPVGVTVAIGDKFVLSQDSFEQIVFQDAASLVARAAAPYPVDLTRFAAATLPLPVFSWMPLQNPIADQDIRQLIDVEPTLTQIRALGAGGDSWTGTPEAGYTYSAGNVQRYVNWTAQLASAPSRLMPDVSPSYTTRQRNRTYFDWKYTQPVYIDASWNVLSASIYTPPATVYPVSDVTFDYTQFRRVSVSNSGSPAFSESVWSGSAWSAETHPTVPAVSGGPWFPCSMAPMPGVTATAGPTPYGQALLCLVVNGAGTARQLHLYWLGGTAVTLDVSSCPGASGGVLVRTPWGVYLVGPGGYGKITYSGGALSLAWVGIFEATYNWLLPSTFCAMDATNLYSMVRMDVYDNGKLVTGTWMLRLAATPDPAHPELAIQYMENCTPGISAVGTLFRDPSMANRLLGTLGSRFFQVAAQMPRTIERVRALSLSAGEMLEHIAQVQNTLMVPRPDGVLEMISRNVPATLVDITVDQISVEQTRLSKNFFSVVRVSGAEDVIYADAQGPTLGGRSLEVTSHPMIWSIGQCFAMATALVSFLGVPRNEVVEKWFWSDADSAPPWESLPRWSKVRVNMGSSYWITTGMVEDIIQGTCETTLLEVP